MSGSSAMSPYNLDPAIRDGMRLPAAVSITDLTLREGRQVGGVWVELHHVQEYAARAAEAGVSVLEMHHSDPDEIRAVKGMDLGVRVQALVHPTAALSPERCREEIDACLEVGTDILSIALAISDHNHGLVRAMAGLDISREQIVENACAALEYGRAQDADIGVILMDFTRLDLARLTGLCAQLADAGATHVRLDDICAPAIPAVYRHHTRAVKDAVGDVRVAIHSHNDFDLALAAQLAGLEGGAEILEASVNGLGERAGLPNLASLASVLELMYGYDTGIRLDRLQGLSDFVAEAWGQPVPPRTPVVGRNAFSHAVEVHYVMDDDVTEWAWNAWLPEVVGNRTRVPLCKYSGPYAVADKARRLGLPEVTSEQAPEIVRSVREELRRRRRDPDDATFAAIVAAVAGGGDGSSSAIRLLDPSDATARVPADHVDSLSRTLLELHAEGRVLVTVCEMQDGGYALAHAHTGADQVLFVVDGALGVREPEGAFVEVGPGQALHVPAAVAHEVRNASGTTARYLALTVQIEGGSP